MTDKSTVVFQTPSAYQHCMIDFETLSLRPDAVVLQAGWCFFDVEPDKVPHIYPHASHKVGISAEHQRSRTISKSTLEWWEGQDVALSEDVMNGQYSLEFFAREFFDSWSYSADSTTQLWAKGADFDIAILKDIFDQLEYHQGEDADGKGGKSYPWGHREIRCLRTLSSLYPDIERVDYGKPHDALDDAIAQAMTVQKIMSYHLGDVEPE